MGAKATKLIEENGKVVGVSGLRHGKEPFEVRADVVVAADGRYSTLAKLGGFETEYERHDFDVIWFTIEQPPGLGEHLLRLAGRGARPDAAEVSAPHPGRHRPADGRVEALARPGRGDGGRSHPPLRPDLQAEFAGFSARLQAVLPARGHHSPDAASGRATGCC